MRKITYQKLVLTFFISMSLTSCFKAEPLNAECDIERVTIHTSSPLNLFFQESDTLQDINASANEVRFIVRYGADITAIAPDITTTPGATVEPASGVVQDFSNGPVSYTVTSEDGEYTRHYKISFDKYHNQADNTKDVIAYPFDNYYLYDHGNFYVWSDTINGTELKNWASGNLGYAISGMTNDPEKFPTVPASEEGHPTCVKLTTLSTGSFGKTTHMPIAAGNIFIGDFDVKQAVSTRGMKSTKFGLPFPYQPATFCGHYRYKRGDVMTDSNSKVIGGQDYGTIYAVFYDNHDQDGNAFVLHGDDVLTSQQIISIANVGNIDNTNEWKEFSVKFETLAGRAIDPVKLKNMGYSLAIVATSSINGADFEGAIGSTLYIDDFSVQCSKVK